MSTPSRRAANTITAPSPARRTRSSRCARAGDNTRSEIIVRQYVVARVMRAAPMIASVTHSAIFVLSDAEVGRAYKADCHRVRSIPWPSIPFIDLQAQRRRLGASLSRAIEAAVEGGQWIMGPQVRELEEKLAEFAGVKHALACANGTDALMLVLRAWDIGPGDAVFVPAFTFAASAEVVALVGADARLRRCARRHLQHGSGESRSRHRAGRDARANSSRAP